MPFHEDLINFSIFYLLNSINNLKSGISISTTVPHLLSIASQNLITKVKWKEDLIKVCSNLVFCLFHLFSLKGIMKNSMEQVRKSVWKKVCTVRYVLHLQCTAFLVFVSISCIKFSRLCKSSNDVLNEELPKNSK